MPRVGFEPMILVFELSKVVPTDCAANVIKFIICTLQHISKRVSKSGRDKKYIHNSERETGREEDIWKT
jgi:hypothetical protein